MNDATFLLCYSANFAYLLSAVICAAVRWYHMCRPYDREGSYYYPGRKQVTLFYLTVLLQFPYLLDIHSEAAWQYVRVSGILFYPLCSSMLLLKYFRGESRHKRLRRLAISVPPGILLAGLFLNAVGGGILPEAALRKVVLLSVAVALCQLGYWFKISVWLLRKIRFHHQNRYSNTEDFPTGLARKAIVSLLVLMLSMWAVFLTDDRYWKAGTDILCTFIQVIMLITILHPHWKPMEMTREPVPGSSGEASGITETPDTGLSSMPPEETGLPAEHPEETAVTYTKNERRMKEMEEKAIRLIQERQLYRNRNLKIDDVAELLGTNSTYLYQVFSRRSEGTFYRLINELRIEYCKQLLLENPQIKHEALVGQAGISSTSTFYRLFKNYTGQTPTNWLRDRQKAHTPADST